MRPPSRTWTRSRRGGPGGARRASARPACRARPPRQPRSPRRRAPRSARAWPAPGPRPPRGGQGVDDRGRLLGAQAALGHEAEDVVERVTHRRPPRRPAGRARGATAEPSLRLGDVDLAAGERLEDGERGRVRASAGARRPRPASGAGRLGDGRRWARARAAGRRGAPRAPRPPAAPARCPRGPRRRPTSSGWPAARRRRR